MLGTISSIEDATPDGHKGIIPGSGNSEHLISKVTDHPRFQQAIAMSINDRNSPFVGDADVVWLQSDYRSETFVERIDVFAAFSRTANVQQPKIAQLSRERPRDALQVMKGPLIWHEIVEKQRQYCGKKKPPRFD